MKYFYSLFFALITYSLAVSQNVGVGTSNPAQKLEVAGWVEIGDESEGISGTAGAIRYHSIGKIQFHDGTQWVDILSGNNADEDWLKVGGGVPTVTDDIYHTGNVGIGTVMPVTSLHINATDAVVLPGGTTAERPSTPPTGALRFNSDNKALEYYDGTQWVSSNMEQVPIGTIVPFAGPNIPSGWLVCDGSTVSRATYSDLFGAIGASWGSGDGSSTFNLPDLRGRFVRGVDAGTGRDPDVLSRTASASGGNTGNAVGSIQGHAIPDHTISVSGNTSSAGAHTHNWGSHWSTDNSQSVTNDNGDGGGNTLSDGHFWWGHTTYPSSQYYDYPGAALYGGNHTHDLYLEYGDDESDMLGLNGNDLGSGPDVVRQTAGTGAHSHNVRFFAHRHWIKARPTTSAGAHTHSISATASGISGTNVSSETRPQNVNVQYIIKAENTGNVAIKAVNIPAGTIGQTLRNDGSNWVATGNLYNSGTNVGIGTTNPNQSLEVSGVVRATQGVEVNDGSVVPDNENGIYWHGTSKSYAIYREAGAWSSPFPDLHIGFHTGIKLGANSSYNGIRFYNDYDMSTLVMSVNDASTSGANDVYVANNLGVGVTPSQQLHSAGNIRFDGRYAYFGANQYLYGDNSSALYWTNNHSTITQLIMRDAQNTIYGRLYGNGDGANFGLLDGDGSWSYLAAKDNYTSFRINGSEKVRILNSGNVGIGTSAPGDLLHVNGTLRSSGTRCKQGTAGGFGGNFYNLFWDGAGVQMWVDVSYLGNISLTSDRRLKSNIKTVEDNAIDRVMALKPISFEYKTIDGTIFKGDGRQHEGFIADELQQVIPSAVNGEKEALTSKGTIQPQTLNIAPIVSVLTKAMQEQQENAQYQQKEIDRLSKQIEVLKAENSALKNVKCANNLEMLTEEMEQLKVQVEYLQEALLHQSRIKD